MHAPTHPQLLFKKIKDLTRILILFVNKKKNNIAVSMLVFYALALAFEG